MTTHARLHGRPALLTAASLALTLAVTMVAPNLAWAAPLGGVEQSTLNQEAIVSPQELGDGSTLDLLYPDPTEGLSIITPPEANSGGTAEVAYPLILPKGRGMTPELALTYSSGGSSSWAGLGWDLSVGDISVDTTWGAPRFCDGTAKQPPCGNVESESYVLDGAPLVPTAARSEFTPRIAERQDFTRKVETEFEQIIRHGDSPKNYWWEVRDKQGGVRFYGGYPDEGGPVGRAGTRTGEERNDRTRKASDIVTDAAGNGVRWLLSAQRDVGVNMFRYEYTTVTYQRSSTSPTGWTALGAGVACTSQPCAKHTYLSRIYYTGAAQLGTAAEDAAYEIRFIRDTSGRRDPVLDAKGGFLDLEQDLLQAIEVHSLKANKPVTRYQLHYATGATAFNKSRLVGVSQIGCAGLATCPTTGGVRHDFTYFDEVEAGKGFEENVAVWDTQTAPSGVPVDSQKASPLGASLTTAADGHVYVGFNPVSPSKTGSAGGSFAMNGSTNRSIVEFLDINGDGLPDKVYRASAGSSDGTIKFQLNTSRPGDALNKQVTFSDAIDVKDLTIMPKEWSIGVQGGVEAYFGVYGVFNVSGSWSFVDSYFTDVNADGLPDMVDGTKVLFNHLDCGGANNDDPTQCKPTFSTDDTKTRVPLSAQAVPVTDDAYEQTVAQLRAAIPPVDTLRRWVAPFAGDVRVTGTATLQNPGDSAAGSVRVALEHGSASPPVALLGSSSLTTAAKVWSIDRPISVAKGDRLYFRAGSRPDGSGDEVKWAATIAYTTWPSSSPDVNLLDQRSYSLVDDFTLVGRPDIYTPMPEAGQARLRASIHKTQATSDDVRPTVRRRAAAVDAVGTVSTVPVTVTAITAAGAVDPPRQKTITQQGAQWCVADATSSFGCFATQADALARTRTIGAGETGRFRIEATPTIGAPLKDAKGVITATDAVAAHLAVDSPIDVRAITALDRPSLCYPKADGSCDDTRVNVSPVLDVDVYPINTLTAPATAWSSTLDRTVRTRITGSITGPHEAGEIVLTIKTASGLVHKERVPVAKTTSSATTTLDQLLSEVTFVKDGKYWIDLTVRDTSLSAALQGVDLVAEWTEGSGSTATTKTENIPQVLNWAGPQGYFPVAWRGWAAVGYNADGTRATSVVTEADFTTTAPGGDPYEDEDEACQALYGGACPDDASVNDKGFTAYDSGGGATPQIDLEAATAEIPLAFAYRPELGETLSRSWMGPHAGLRADASGISASDRVGDNVPTLGGTTPGVRSAPKLMGEAGPIFMLMAGVGPLGGGLAFGWSRSLVDYIDMNGDGFPDTVRPESIVYTNPRGSQDCVTAAGPVSCVGGGAGALSTATTLAVSIGFGGSPIGISGNSKGTSNSTKGNSANRGGSGSDTSWGADLGFSLGGGASFTNPTSANSEWDAERLKKVPGEKGVTVQQVLADLNGDGLPDRVSVDATTIRVQLNLGYSFSEEFTWAQSAFESANSYSGSVGAAAGFSVDFFGLSGGYSHNGNVDQPNFSWNDVNGDGILDALSNQGGVVKVAFGTGTGIAPFAPYGTHESLPFTLIGDSRIDNGPQIRQDSSESDGGGADVTIGIPLCAVACYLIINAGAHGEDSITSTDVDLVDVNGDGFADSVSRKEDTGAEQMEVRLNRQGRTGLLKTVTTPMRGTIDLDYHRAGNTLDHPGSAWVLDEVKVASSRGDDGVAPKRSTFVYGNLRFDFVQRTSLGFDAVTEHAHYTDAAGQPKVRAIAHRFFNTTVFNAGLEWETTVYDGTPSTATMVQRTTSTWQLRNLDTKDPNAAGQYAALDLTGVGTDALLQVRATPQLASLRQQWFAAGTVKQETRIDYVYNLTGDPTRITDVGETESATDDLVAQLTYSDCEISSTGTLNDTSATLPDLPGPGCGAALAAPPGPGPAQPGAPLAALRTTSPNPFWSDKQCQTWVHLPVTIAVSSGGTLLRYRDGRQAICDNNSVTLLNEMLALGSSIETSTFAQTRLAYDGWGSYDRIVYPPDADGKRYAVQYVYDDVNAANVAEVTDYELVGDGDGLPMVPDPADPANEIPDPDDEVFAFLEEGTLPSGATATGITSTATFDPLSGRVSTQKDADGNITAYLYDSLNRTKKVTSPDLGTVEFTYAPTDASYPYATAKHLDQFDTATPKDTIDTAVFVDGSGLVTQRKREASFFVPATGAVTDGWAVEGATELDGLGRTVKEWFPSQQLAGALETYHSETPAPTIPPTKREWDAFDRMTKETTPNGAVTSTAYGFGAIGTVGLFSADVTDPLGRHSVTLSDVRDNVLAKDDRPSASLPGGLTEVLRTAYTYDPLGQLLEVTTPGGHQTVHTYDRAGRRTSTATPDGGVITYGYDAAGNKTSEQSPVLRADNNSRTRFGYDFGHLTSIDYPDATPDVTFEIGGYMGTPSGDNGAGKVVSVTDAGRQQQLGYDANGRVDSEKTTMRGKHPNSGPFTTTFDYDWLGRLGSVVLPDGETVSNGYDAGGRLNRVTGSKTCTDLGTLAAPIDATTTTITVAENPHAGASNTPATPFTIHIDVEQLRVTARTATAVEGLWEYTVERGINGTVDLPTAAPHGVGANVVSDTPLACTYRYLDQLAYDTFGQVAFQGMGNDTTSQVTREPDTRRLARALTLSPGGSRELQDQHYQYDLAGNVKVADNQLPTDVPSLFGGPTRQEYTYDGRYRLFEAKGTWDYEPKTRRSYTYHATIDDTTSRLTASNQRDWTNDTACKKRCTDDVQEATTFDRTSISYGGAGPNQVTTSVDAFTGATETSRYDADGNLDLVTNPDMIRTMTWDAAGKMTSIVDHNPNNEGRKMTSYQYDYAGRLAIEAKEQGQTSYVNPWVTVRNGTMWKNIWAGQSRLAVKFSEQDSYEEKLYFLHKDLQGSTNIVTDKAGKVFQHHEYFPTGQVWVKEDSTIFRTPYQFAGGYVDEDHGLVNFGQRWYNPATSQFASVDPILTDDPMAIVEQPEVGPAYTYAFGNPTSFVDTDGRRSTPITSADVRKLTTGLRIDGKPLDSEQTQALRYFFGKHSADARGRMGMSWLKKFAVYEKRQKTFDRLSARPALEFEIEDGKLKSIKLGAMVGKRKKFDFADSPGSSKTSTTQQQGAGGSAAGGGKTGGQGTTAGGGGGSPSPAPSSPKAVGGGTGPSGGGNPSAANKTGSG